MEDIYVERCLGGEKSLKNCRRRGKEAQKMAVEISAMLEWRGGVSGGEWKEWKEKEGRFMEG